MEFAAGLSVTSGVTQSSALPGMPSHALPDRLRFPGDDEKSSVDKVADFFNARTLADERKNNGRRHLHIQTLA
jgi:hypothetical protein